MASPDFDAVVRHVVMLNAVLNDEDHTDAMVEALRLVWNARGAADCDEVVGVGDSISPWSAVEITDAIRKLDR